MAINFGQFHELMHSLKSRTRVSQTYMTIKIDISKACDRVEWNFLERTMKAFGFSETWINWIIATVRTVNYSVLINGNPQGHITPEQGVRQGNPLSPYLFILCADVMSHLLDVRAQKGKIKGIKPHITNLLFADDSLFFCQANFKNCGAIKEIFSIYEKCSGQILINQDKSMIITGLWTTSRKS